MITLPPNLKRQFADFYNKIKTGELRTFIPMLSLLKINGKPFTLQRHFFMAPLFDTVQPPQTLLMCGRQVAKSTTIAANSILRGFFIPHYHQLIISPQQDQVQRFNAAAVMPLLKSCPILPLFMSSAESNKLALKTFRNSSMIYLDYCGAGGNADPSRLRGIANIASICIDESQDVPYQYIPIIMEVSSASINWGFVTYAGTPKTTDTTLALLWNRSSQAEWVIRCTHCGYFNVPNPEQDLLKMIGAHYPICSKCGGRIWPENGGWVHAKPDLAMTFRSMHLPQVIHPLHSINEIKWAKLLDKVNNYSEVALYNEVLGWPYDAATSPLTMSDLIAAQFDPMDAYGNVIDIKSPEDVQRVSDAYSYITVGCDFSGGGPISDSYTAFAVLGLRRDNQVVDILYGERLPKGISPTEEARILLRWIEGSGANAFAFDNGGSGFVRLEMMKQMGLMSIPGLTICPETYVGPRGGDIMKLSPAQREPDLKFYTVDKSRSLAMCIAGIKAKRIRCRRFNPEDEDAYIRDFLALIEDPRESRGKETVILISKKISVPDDFSHAVNFGCCQIFDRFGAYIPIGSKYDATRLLFDENHKPLIPDEVFGPRGDFDRFVAGCNEAVSVIEPDDDYF